jgi:outer membrane receptor protein involved in Fe transport
MMLRRPAIVIGSHQLYSAAAHFVSDGGLPIGFILNAIPSCVIVNAMLGYEAKRWGMGANLRNTTNRRYFLAANAAGALVGKPISVMANIRANF